MDSIKIYEVMYEIRKEFLSSAIKQLKLSKESKILDAACGIGNISKLLAKELGNNATITGIDISDEFLNYANNSIKNTILQDQITFLKEDINNLSFNDNSFDCIFSVDTVWPGPKNFGCPCEDPLPIIKEFYKVVKPGGKIALLFWSGQKLLSGFPVLEARLNSIDTALIPYTNATNPSFHILRAKNWFEKFDIKDIKTKTFTIDFCGPLSEKEKEGLLISFKMLWENAKDNLETKDKEKYMQITDPTSSDFILNCQDYYGFINYTMFYGTII
jgi:ubiquinone/menaquinone biosynthesis C-methylase UbiE